MLMRFSTHGTTSNPPMPSSVTNATIRLNVTPSAATGGPPAALSCTSELSIVSIITATTSSSTVMPIASWPDASCVAPISCRIFPMIADDDTMSIPARNKLCVLLQPSAAPINRER